MDEWMNASGQGLAKKAYSQSPVYIKFYWNKAISTLRTVMIASVLQWQSSEVIIMKKPKIFTSLPFKKKFASDCLE